VHESDTALGVRVLDDTIAKCAERSIGRPEGAEDDVGGGGDTVLGDDLVGDLIDETGNMLVFACSLFYFFAKKKKK
jgi:hypothetical protein